MNHYIVFILIILHLPIWFYLSQGLLHLLISLVASLFKKNNNIIEELNDFAIIITAHEEIEFIPPIIDSINKQNYSKYQVYVVADNCNIGSIKHLESNKISILQPSQPLHSKVKSIDYAISAFKEDHNFMVIFDPDNLLDPSYLTALNHHINSRNYKVVQTRLMAKNLNSPLAKIDALGSSYYDFISRQSKSEVGLSSHIYGLGISIHTGVYKEIKYKKVVGGFDKRIQIDLLRAGYRIGYCQDAKVYDEKTSNSNDLETQRTRWLHAYFKYSKDGWKLLWQGVKKFNLDWFYFGVESVRPPIVVLLLCYATLGIIDIVIMPKMLYFWILFIFIFISSILIIILKQKENRSNFNSILYIPKFVLILISSLFGIKKAKTKFLKTNHSDIVYIDEVLKRSSNA